MVKRIAVVNVTLRGHAYVEQHVRFPVEYDDETQTEDGDVIDLAEEQVIDKMGEDWQFLSLDIDDTASKDVRVEYTREK